MLAASAAPLELILVIFEASYHLWICSPKVYLIHLLRLCPKLSGVNEMFLTLDIFEKKSHKVKKCKVMKTKGTLEKLENEIFIICYM